MADAEGTARIATEYTAASTVRRSFDPHATRSAAAERQAPGDIVEPSANIELPMLTWKSVTHRPKTHHATAPDAYSAEQPS
jgi:hypothetical protein